jgi:hypothetical protein
MLLGYARGHGGERQRLAPHESCPWDGGSGAREGEQCTNGPLSKRMLVGALGLLLLLVLCVFRWSS